MRCFIIVFLLSIAPSAFAKDPPRPPTYVVHIYLKNVSPIAGVGMGDSKSGRLSISTDADAPKIVSDYESFLNGGTVRFAKLPYLASPARQWVQTGTITVSFDSIAAILVHPLPVPTK